MQDIQTIIEDAGSNCSKYKEVKSWEIIGGIISGSTISVEKSFLKVAETSTQYALSIRLFGEKGKTGSVSITKMDLPFIENSIKRTVSLMKGSLPNPEFKCLAKPPDKYPKITTPYDTGVNDLTIDDTTDIIDKFMQIKSMDERVVSVSGDVNYSNAQYVILNSNGINLSNKETSISLSTEITMEESIKGSKENSNGYEGQSYIFFKEADPDAIIQSALSKATLGLRKSKISTDEYPIILAPQAVILLFNRTLASSINAQAIYEKRSFMQNRLGKKIASKQLEIRDDPWLQNGLSTAPWDMEGTPTKPRALIEDGILQSYLHNMYTANLFETVSTGHGTRSLLSSSVGISPSNMLIKPGDMEYSSMIESIDTGVLMEASYDRPNFVTGEFSGLIAAGYLIENGEIKNALRESMIGVNIIDLYSNIAGIGKEIHRKGANYVPYIKISSAKISAKE